MSSPPSNPKTTGVNYLYFLTFFTILIILTFSHFFRLGQPLWGMHLFFLIYALGQALLEVLCFVLLGYAVHHRAPHWAFKIYAGLLFAFLLAHFADFTMVRVLDASLSYFFKFFFGCGIDHFRVAFQAMNMNNTMIATIVGSILFVPLAGIVFYWATHKVSLRKPLNIPKKYILGASASLALLLLLLDIIARPYITSDTHNKYRKTLPLGSTFLTPTKHCLALSSPIQMPRKEEEVQKHLRQLDLSIKKKPNIYLFVIETFRSDFLNKQTAPHLSQFQSEHLSPKIGFSNANTTHLSWFSIFHSIFPYQWTSIRDQWEKGSAPLQLLKKLGYRLRVYSSADLSYFNMDRIIFGRNLELADSIRDFSHLRNSEPCERDIFAMKAMSRDLTKEPEGTLFVVFLDSTHSEYSSPKELQPFQPAAASIDYLAITRSEDDLELLKNRYRNAIHWVDHLIGHFFKELKDKDLYDEALIALTGDHGEEFFEEGALFHGTHLNDWQTRVPLMYKFPGPLPGQLPTLSTHLDLFPSILHVLTKRDSWGQFFDGQSLFAKKRWSYALSVQHNGPDVPYEFSLSDGFSRLQARFLNPPFIHTVPSVELIALDTPEGRKTFPMNKSAFKHYEKAFWALLPSKEGLLQKVD